MADADSVTGSWPIEAPGLMAARNLIGGLLEAGQEAAVVNLEIQPWSGEPGVSGSPAGHSELLFEAIEDRLTEQLRVVGAAVLRIAPERHIVVFSGMDCEALGALLVQLATEWGAGVRLGSIRVVVDLIAGLSVSPMHGVESNELLRRAAAALREARRLGVAVCVYRDGLEESHARRRSLRRDLALAVARNELTLVYQPQVTLRTRRVAVLEALLRWQHPQFGAVPPAEFVPIAEECGQITPISNWVLRQACSQLARWHGQGTRLRVAVNLSALDLAGGQLEAVLVETLREHDLAGQSLVLELTEHAIVADLEQASDVMRRIALHGVQFSLDDFGAGHSSLRTLRALPVSEIKIDGSLTRNLARGEPDEVIVRSAVSLAHALRLHVVAEGVESAQALLAAARLGCDRAQGYFVGEPAAPHRVRINRAAGLQGSAPRP